ncbi:hypothetical protein JCM18549_11200 [Halolamina salina]
MGCAGRCGHKRPCSLAVVFAVDPTDSHPIRMPPQPVSGWLPTFDRMRASTLVLAFGAILFAFPVPGTFIAGALVLVAGGTARWYGA